MCLEKILIDLKKMKKSLGILAAAVTILVTGCTYQTTNRYDQKDVNAGNDYVYAHPDSMARQRKMQYEPNSDNELRVMEIEDVLFGSTGKDGSNIAKQ